MVAPLVTPETDRALRPPGDKLMPIQAEMPAEVIPRPRRAWQAARWPPNQGKNGIGYGR